MGKVVEARKRTQEELARRLCCAVISVKLGISQDHCYKSYLKGKQVGADWKRLAEAIWRGMKEEDSTRRIIRVNFDVSVGAGEN
jgi:hypothetical protein